MHPLSARPISTLASSLLLIALLAAGPGPAAAQTAPPRPTARVALVPLDDRPVCLDKPVALAAIADASVVAPPRGVLGRHLKTGDGDAVARWLDDLDLATLDALVVSVDMLAYGGLIGSRVPRVFEADARRRLDALARLRQRRADLPVYAFGSVMRLAPTPDGGDEGWRAKLARWAEISPDAESRTEADALERGLPAGMLDRYREARARNHAINLAVVDLAVRDVVDAVVFAVDEAAPRGVHLAERDALARAIDEAGVGDRAWILTGPDEVAMLLLARALTARFKYQPAVAPVYSSDAAGDSVSRLDGRTPREVVATLMSLAGARQGAGAVQLLVYASRHESPDRADAFAAQAAAAVQRGGRVAVADVDPAGVSQGGSLPLAEALRVTGVLPRLSAYAASNSTGGAAGAALAHGVLHALAVDRVASLGPVVARRVAEAQVRALLHGIVDDFLYQAIVRPQVTEEHVVARQLDPSRLSDAQRPRVERLILDELQPLAESVAADFAVRPWRLSSRPGGKPGTTLAVGELSDLAVSLPWGRMSEVSIGFALAVGEPERAARPPAPRFVEPRRPARPRPPR